MDFIQAGLVWFGVIFANVCQRIAGNEYLAILLVASIIFVAYKVFKRAKRSARS